VYRLLSIVDDIGWIKELVEENMEPIEGLDEPSEPLGPPRIQVERQAAFIKP